ncbi:hypothetical protein [Cyclobacterium xiamenense]|uniref:hypothetical protein n=1 Tax=Cyclobacterium xiamenense TaxID=1297121 RepID=UPI0012B6F547|nr:hypothetical protein [Cyclobacterium xiamenense]
MTLRNLFYLLPLFLFFACEVEDKVLPGTQLLRNSNLSSDPDSVFPWMASQSERIEIGISKEIFLTGNQSLFIANPDSLNFNAGTWSQTYAGPMPAPGSSMELVAFVKGENIRRTYPNAPSVLVTFQLTPRPEDEAYYKNGTNSSTDFFVEGGFDWTPIFVTIDNFPAEVDFIRVNLTTPRGVSGKIYFDEITLTAKKN